MDYRNEFCTPKPIKECVVHDNEFIMPMQSMSNHQMGKLFQFKPNLKIDMETIKRDEPAAEFEAVLKIGMYIFSLDSYSLIKKDCKQLLLSISIK